MYLAGVTARAEPARALRTRKPRREVRAPRMADVFSASHWLIGSPPSAAAPLRRTLCLWSCAPSLRSGARSWARDLQLGEDGEGDVGQPRRGGGRRQECDAKQQ